MANIKDIFLKRKEYDSLNNNFVLPDLPKTYTQYYLDSWSVSPFYGKVDTLGIPIMPNLTELKYCSYSKDKDKVLALAPFTKFFFPFREQYLDSSAIGAINTQSKYFKKDIPPVKGFINGHIEYQNNIKNLYSNFVQNLIDQDKFNFIKDYKEFTQELINYIKKRDTYFTRAGYVESYDYSLLHTGLAIELYKESSSNDDARIDFFNDINSSAFLELCVRNNLKIDREIPWRIYIDIRTKPRKETAGSSAKQLNFKTEIQEFIPEFNDDIQLFFDTYYTKVIPYDSVSYPYFLEFVNIIKSFYDSFTVYYPAYNVYGVKSCGKANVKKIQRNKLQDLDMEIFVDLYLKFRNVELDKVVPRNILESESEMALDLFKELNKQIDTKTAVINAIKYYTNKTGTLAYRNPSLYELDEKSKMP